MPDKVPKTAKFFFQTVALAPHTLEEARQDLNSKGVSHAFVVTVVIGVLRDSAPTSDHFMDGMYVPKSVPRKVMVQLYLPDFPKLILQILETKIPEIN